MIADASEDYPGVGKCVELLSLNNEIVIAGLHTLLARPNLSKVAIGFGGYLMQSENLRRQIHKIAQGSKVLSISAIRMSNLVVQLPCLQEQTKIANFLMVLDDKINYINQQLDQTKLYKKGLPTTNVCVNCVPC